MKSEDMDKNNYFSHDEGITYIPWLQERGIRSDGSGENIYRGRYYADDAIKWWMNSTGHRAQLLEPHTTQVGLAHYGDIWTFVSY